MILDSNIAIDPKEHGEWFGAYKNVDGKQVDRQHYRCITSTGKNYTMAQKVYFPKIYILVYVA